MARSRNIKPGFFTNEQLVELAFSTRLLFIGLWTLADREGRLEDRPKKIKMSLFPADNLDIDLALTELAETGFILRYEVKGFQYIQVVAFNKHQNPHVKEGASTIPAPDKHCAKTMQATLIPDSLNLIPDSNVKAIVPNNVVDACPHQAIIDLYHEHLPMMTQVSKWTEKRADQLRMRWREDKKRQTLKFWETLFKYVANSDFLTGKTSSFQADLEWITKSSNFVKVIEGKYENKAA